MGIEITNWASFTAAEILELRKEGVEVPSDVYKMAKATYEDETVSEEDINSYELVDTSSELNEAQELLAKLLNDMGGEGDNMENLEQIAQVFISKSETAQKTVLKDLTEMDKLSKEIEETQEEITNVQEEAEEDISSLKVEQEELQLKAENGTITEEEQNRLNYINGVISNVSSEADAKTEGLSFDLKKIGAKISNAVIRAGNAKETGDTTAQIGSRLLEEEYDDESGVNVWSLLGGVLTGAIGTTITAIASKGNVKAIGVAAMGWGVGVGLCLGGPLGWGIGAGLLAAGGLMSLFGGRDSEQTKLNHKTGEKAVDTGEQLSGFAEQSRELAFEAASKTEFNILDFEGNEVSYELDSADEEDLLNAEEP